MTQGLFKRIFVLYVLILVLALLGAELSVTRTVREDQIRSLQDTLTVQADLIARNVPFEATATLDALCRELKKLTDTRITIIAMDGKVLGDSDHVSTTMDNHRNRTEVQQADLNTVGMAIRRSDTLAVELLYVAKKIVHNGQPQGFVRLSVPLQDLEAAVNRLRLKIIVTVTLLLMITGILILLQIDRLRRLTVQVRDFAQSMAQGELGKRLFLHRAGEFEEIAGSLNTMALSIQSDIKTLRDEKAKFETALLGISDGVLLLDQTGRVELANRAFHEMFGMKSDILGKPFLEVVRNHILADMVREAHERHLPASGELDIAFPRQLYLFATALPIVQESMREDRYRGTVVALHDITQLKKLEQVRKDFVANVSHEIKTPITAILGFSETLLSGALDDREHAVKFIETIRANSQRINNLVDDLMTISKIELGVIKVEKSEVAFEDVADAVLTILKDKADRKNLSLTTSIPHDLGTIEADRDRLIQILTNLVDNAIKFTEQGGVNFGAVEEKGRMSLFVEDTGVGVPEKHLSRLGERFYRVDTARSRTMGGTGLGLAIVKHLVKAHGWDMRIESVVGKGTRVSITLPA
jgi:two-component system phosphate regulon sensor histidine kinase PhoR